MANGKELKRWTEMGCSAVVRLRDVVRETAEESYYLGSWSVRWAEGCR